MAAVAKLKAILGMDTTQYRAGMRTATGATQQFKTTLASVGASIAAAFSIRAVMGFVKSIVSFASEIQHTAQNLNVTTDALQGLNAAALKYGMSVEDMVKLLGKLRQSQGKVAEGDKEYTDSLKLLNIEAGKFAGADTAQALAMLASAYVASGQSALAYSAVLDLVGRAGKKATAFMIELANVGLDGVIKSGKESGSVIDKELIEKLELAGTRWDQYVLKFKVGGANILAVLDTLANGWEKYQMAQEHHQARLTPSAQRAAIDAGLLDEQGNPIAASKSKDTPEPSADGTKAKEHAKLAEMRAEWEEKSYLRMLDQLSASERLVKLNEELVGWDDSLQGMNAEELYKAEYKRWELVDQIASTEKEIESIKAKSVAAENQATSMRDKYERRRRDILEAPYSLTGRDIRHDQMASVGGLVGGSRVGVDVADKQLQKMVEDARRQDEILRVNREQLDVAKEQSDKMPGTGAP